MLADPVPGTPSAAKVILTPSEIAWVAQAGGFNASGTGMTDVVIATAIALAESGGNAKAYNGKPPDQSYGLWQINMIGDLGPSRRKQYNLFNNEHLFDPVTNARVAKGIKDGSGWRAWSVYKNGAWLTQMSKAMEGAKNPTKPANKSIGNREVSTAEGIMEAIAAFLQNPFASLTEFLQGIGLRLAGFIGGGVLVILAVVLYIRSQK